MWIDSARMQSSHKSPLPCIAFDDFEREECIVYFIVHLFGSFHSSTSLLTSGGTIPASKYNSSTFAGFRHSVITLHAWFLTILGQHIRLPSHLRVLYVFVVA